MVNGQRLMVKSQWSIVFIGLALVVIGFLVGFKAGLFLFSNRTPINADNMQINAESWRESTIASPEPALKENFCVEGIKFLDEEDKKFCFQEPKLTEKRGLEVNLTAKKALIYDQGKLIKIFPLLYQSPEDKWFQAPTGYYQAGVKYEKHLSSLFPVIMPYAIQYYEDFFIHGIPYYQNGTNVSSNFTGGCLRFENEIAKEIYDFLQTGDQIVVYKTFDDLKIKSQFNPPVELDNYWIRQRFLNPYRKSWRHSGTKNLKLDYDQHAGLDFAPNHKAKNLSVYAIADGLVAKIQFIDEKEDDGLGNTIILEHQIDGRKIYSLYAHLASINENLSVGSTVKKGDIIGTVGNSGYGCQNYWRVGTDGCDSSAPSDIHLHFEIRKMLDSPYFGYTPDYPQDYGYLDPTEFLFEKIKE